MGAFNSTTYREEMQGLMKYASIARRGTAEGRELHVMNFYS